METLIIVVILAIMTLILAGNAVRNKLAKKRPKNENASKKESWEATDSMNAVFLKNAEGKPVINLVRTYNPGDMALLRSLLDSAGINTFVNFDAMNSLYPGVNLGNHTDIILTIFEEDAAEAKEIVANYLAEQRDHEPEKAGSRIRNVAETVLGGYPMPSGRNKTLPELLI
jgi:hypothetical protein